MTLPSAPSASSALFARNIDRIATQAHGRFVMVSSAVLAAAIAWSATTDIDKVTRGPGHVVPQLRKQEVQHLEGGIVEEILVHEGDRVTAGQPLMRVENSFFRSELAQASIDLAAKRLRLVRLAAEAYGRETLEFPADSGVDPARIEGEINLFRLRLSNFRQQTEILEQQRRQKELELSEMRSRQPLVLREREIAEERLISLQRLAAAGAASLNDRLLAESDQQQASARLSDLVHEMPRVEASLLELDERKQQLLSQFEADADKERAQTEIDVEKLSQSVAALQDRNRRSDVIAPIAGIINKLEVATIGGVVKPGETLAEIVPEDASISVEMRLAPADRGDVWVGEKAIVKVSAYEFSTYGGIHARVADVSADALQDEKGAPYFRVRLEADASTLGPDHPILPGMTADVDVIGERQSVLTALLRPLRRLKENALRQ